MKSNEYSCNHEETVAFIATHFKKYIMAVAITTNKDSKIIRLQYYKRWNPNENNIDLSKNQFY